MTSARFESLGFLNTLSFCLLGVTCVVQAMQPQDWFTAVHLLISFQRQTLYSKKSCPSAFPSTIDVTMYASSHVSPDIRILPYMESRPSIAVLGLTVKLEKSFSEACHSIHWRENLHECITDVTMLAICLVLYD